ncbi:ferredoxin [Clostridia bacterium]|nr:ferredoxin [Clostridia bacterium]
MFINSKQAEEQAVLNLAYAVCAAARTAPKACGIDHMDTAVLTGEDKVKVSDELRRIGKELDAPFFVRDADNVDASPAVVLVGVKYEPRDLNELCGVCGFANCAECSAAGATCVFTAVDLGIALGSAVSLVMDNRVDNRIMFTIGKAATALGLLGEYKLIMGIPLSVSGKSPFFDRD